MTTQPTHLKIFLPPPDPDLHLIRVPKDTEAYRRGALEELRKQLGNATTQNRKEKLMARIEYWENKK